MSGIILPGEDGDLFQRDRDWHPAANTPQYKSTTFRAPRHALLALGQTSSETTGPAFGHGTLGKLDNDLIRNYSQDGTEAIGQRIIVYGQVLDENARAVPNTLVEFWQANAGGRYRHKREGYLAALDPNFGGCGRAITDADGFYHFRTIKPGAYPWPNGANDWRPAHIHFSVFGHAFAQRLITQMYFEGDPMIWQCPIVGTIPDKAAIDQLIARLDRQNTTPMDALAYRFDIVLRGRRSTMFENRLEGELMLHPTPTLKETPSQTAGPYVHIGMVPNFCDINGVYAADLGATMLADDTQGERIEIAGRVIDGYGAPVFDGLMEIWQADATGTYLKPADVKPGAFSGWGRQAMDQSGGFSFKTIKPGRVAGPDGKPMAPHVSLWIVARGINIGLQTRLYFDDEADANAADWVLSRIPSPARRKTLIARKEADAVPRYVLDIRLQGENETVFFDL